MATHPTNDAPDAAVDRAGKAYWEAAWEAEHLPPPADPGDLRLDNYVTRQFHELFERELPQPRATMQLLEVGCARSTWLPYFAIHHGFAVTGLDYSSAGCAQARRILELAEVEGEVVEGDMFAPPPSLLGRFDVVVSFGLVEHFTDTPAALEALKAFLKPGGTLLTTTPNMGRGSLVGTFQRVLNRPVYDVHESMSRNRLAYAHRDAGLDLAWCRYFMTMNLSAVNIDSWPDGRRRRIVKRLLSGSSKVVWTLERRGIRFPPNRVTSPYVASLATAPSAPVEAAGASR